MGDPEEASDVAQDAFVRAYAKLRGFRSASGLYTWLYKITLNIGLNVLRKRKSRSFIRLSEPSAPQLSISANQERNISRTELRNRIEEAIAELHPQVVHLQGGSLGDLRVSVCVADGRRLLLVAAVSSSSSK